MIIKIMQLKIKHKIQSKRLKLLQENNPLGQLLRLNLGSRVLSEEAKSGTVQTISLLITNPKSLAKALMRRTRIKKKLKTFSNSVTKMSRNLNY